MSRRHRKLTLTRQPGLPPLADDPALPVPAGIGHLRARKWPWTALDDADFVIDVVFEDLELRAKPHEHPRA